MLTKLIALAKAHYVEWVFYFAVTVLAMFAGRIFGEIVAGIAVLGVYVALSAVRVGKQDLPLVPAILGGIGPLLAVLIWFQFIA